MFFLQFVPTFEFLNWLIFAAVVTPATLLMIMMMMVERFGYEEVGVYPALALGTMSMYAGVLRILTLHIYTYKRYSRTET